MDGVLVDSEHVILNAAIEGLRRFGVNAEPEDFRPFIGAGEDRFIGGVAEKYGVKFVSEMKSAVYSIYLERVDRDIRTYPGTRDILKRLRSSGYVLGLASSADRIKIDANLRAAKIPASLFSAILSGNDVMKKKPDPEVFLKTAERLGKVPAECLVVEDAVNGVRAAKAAGMSCAALTTTFPRDLLAAEGPDVILTGLDGLIGWLETGVFRGNEDVHP
jgi:HAD superfamily hydrolase (TIGR01509 family)